MNRIIPLILAVALFMENMDSTVIATSLPAIAADIQTSPIALKLALTSYLVSLAIFIPVSGWMADRFGAKTVFRAAIAVFVAGSIACAFSNSLGAFVVSRFLQGIGATAGLVVPRAIVRDLYTGNEAARLMSLLMLVFSVSPILAPLTGSFISESFGWRGVFWAVTAAALVAVVLLATSLKETRPPEERAGSSFGEALRAYRFLMGNGRFLGLTAIGSFAISSFFVYLSNSSFLLIDHYGLTPRVYSLFFSINAVSFFAMSQLTGRLAERFGLNRVVRYAVSGYAGVMLLLLALTASGFDSLGVLATLLFFGYGFVGLVIPSTSVLAMDDHGEIAGTASALLGTLQLGIGAVAMAVAGLFADGTPLPMVAGIAICAVLSFTLAQFTLGRSREAVEAPAE